MLVHGAWYGGWCYAGVADALRAQGHRVFAPTLTGLGERSHLAGFGVINCSTHIQDVINVIRWEQLSEVVLCGHSYGGMVIGGVADAIPGRIASLVYLDALIPENGRSVLDGIESEQLAAVVTAANGGYMLPPPAAAALNVNQADRVMVDALCTAQPLATCLERLTLKGAYAAIVKKTYVRATGVGWDAGSAPDVRARKG